MFKIPTTIASPSQAEPIFIDEDAEAISFVITMLVSCRQSERELAANWDVFAREAAIRICDKFDIEACRHVFIDLMNELLQTDPYDVFVLASHANNLALGRKAITFMEFSDEERHLWDVISGARSEWQVALIKLVVPDPTYFAKVHSGQTPDIGPPLISKKLAERFQPQ